MCKNRLCHIKNIALYVIAEDEFQPDPEDLVIPAEEEELVEEKETKTPKYIGEKIKEEENKRTFEGGGVQIKTCPICGHNNPIYFPACENCFKIYQQLKPMVEKTNRMSKTFNPENRAHRLALFDNIGHYVMGLGQRGVRPAPDTGKKRSYGPEVLDKIWQNKGITELGPDSIRQVVPTNTNKMDKAIFEMNSIRDEKGDLVVNEKTGLPTLQKNFNWYALNDVLKKLSVPNAGTANDYIGMDEFYEIIMEYNKNHPNKIIGHIDIGPTYHKEVSTDILPEFTGKTEVGSGSKAILQETAPDSKSSGYLSLWPWNSYTTPSGQPRSGVADAFNDRLKELPKLELMAEENLLNKKITKQMEAIDNIREEMKLEETALKSNVRFNTLITLRKTNIGTLAVPEATKTKLKKTKAQLEKRFGDELDEKLEELSQYHDKLQSLIEKAREIQTEIIETRKKLTELS